MSVTSHDLHLLTGAYAVDALTGDELAEFERHLDRCESCAEEVTGLRETAARLAMAAAVDPPPQLRRQVLDAATRVRQLPPSRSRLLAGGPAGRGRRLRLVRPRPIAIAAMAAAIVALIAVQAGTRHQLDQAQAGNRAIASVLSAPDARIELGTASVGGTLTAVVSTRDREAVVTAAGLPAQGDARVYQLWVISAAGARSAGLLPAGRAGVAPLVLADDVQPGDQLAITIEPAGGTRQPTTSPIVEIRTRA